MLASRSVAAVWPVISAFDVMKYLFYPMLLLVSSLVAIFLVKEKNEK